MGHCADPCGILLTQLGHNFAKVATFADWNTCIILQAVQEIKNHCHLVIACSCLWHRTPSPLPLQLFSIRFFIGMQSLNIYSKLRSKILEMGLKWCIFIYLYFILFSPLRLQCGHQCVRNPSSPQSRDFSKNWAGGRPRCWQTLHLQSSAKVQYPSIMN